MHPEKWVTFDELIDVLGFSERGIKIWVKQLCDCRLLVKECRGKYRVNPHFDINWLDRTAKRYRTNGIGEAAASHFYRERSAHVASLLRNRGFECGEDGLSFIVKQIVSEAQRQMSLIHKVKMVFNDMRGFRVIEAPLVNAVPAYVMRC